MFYFSGMEKLLKDRLNHLKSELAQLRNKKMDKSMLTNVKINDLLVRVREVEYLLEKL